MGGFVHFVVAAACGAGERQSLVGLVCRASGSETFKRFLPQAPFSNSAPLLARRLG